MEYRPKKIISGGQTGADIGGLMGAERVGIATGGTAPRDFKTEQGTQAEVLRDRFGLVMHPSSNYKVRTLENVKNADAILIFASQPESDGTKLTIDYCEAEEKPYCLVDPSESKVEKRITEFLMREQPAILNITGNRESVSPGLAAYVAATLQSIFIG